MKSIKIVSIIVLSSLFLISCFKSESTPDIRYIGKDSVIISMGYFDAIAARQWTVEYKTTVYDASAYTDSCINTMNQLISNIDKGYAYQKNYSKTKYYFKNAQITIAILLFVEIILFFIILNFRKKSLSKYLEVISKLEKELISANKEIKDHNGKLAKEIILIPERDINMERDLSSSKTKLRERDIKINNLNENISELKTQNKSLQKENDKLQLFKSSAQNDKDEINRLKNELTKCHKKIDSLESNLENKREALKLYKGLTYPITEKEQKTINKELEDLNSKTSS